MNWSIVFFVIMMLLLLRILRLRIRANSSRSESFKRLPPKDQLAVLKECLLNNPFEANLRNLADFAEKNYPFNRMRILQRYSKEVEHSYDNTEALNAEFDSEPGFSTENLIALLEELA